MPRVGTPFVPWVGARLWQSQKRCQHTHTHTYTFRHGTHHEKLVAVAVAIAVWPSLAWRSRDGGALQGATIMNDVKPTTTTISTSTSTTYVWQRQPHPCVLSLPHRQCLPPSFARTCTLVASHPNSLATLRCLYYYPTFFSCLACSPLSP